MVKMYDDLTGLYTFSGFQIKVAEHLTKCNNAHWMICLDIENFKMVNNMYGRKEGDRLLAEIGDTLSRTKFTNLICCRMEADVFYAFIPEKYGKPFEELMLKNNFYADREKITPIELNMGIYRIEDDSMPVSLMCEKAGMALKSVKENQMEWVAVYNENMYKSLMSERELCAQLTRAIEERQLEMYLQPQVNKNGIILGAEALVRWNHPARGLLTPGAFLPLFEKNYMITQIDTYIWEEACRKLKEWELHNMGDMYISINISSRDFESMDVCKILNNLVKKYQIDPKRLRIEITETSLMQNPYQQVKRISSLRNAGFYVEMDDFGSGYTSFRLLQDMQIDAIKLDMNFFSTSNNAESGKKMIDNIVSMAKELCMTVIAEGVEKQADVEYLTKNGCDMFQGYYFSRPMQLQAFEEKIRKVS